MPARLIERLPKEPLAVSANTGVPCNRKNFDSKRTNSGVMQPAAVAPYQAPRIPWLAVLEVGGITSAMTFHWCWSHVRHDLRHFHILVRRRLLDANDDLVIFCRRCGLEDPP